MKINANENVLLLNKKMGANDPAPVPETPETQTVSNPEAGMKALEAMGQQNIAFQGGLTATMKKVGKNVGNYVKPNVENGTIAMLLASLMAMVAPSCTKEENLNIQGKTEITIDQSAISAAIQSMSEQLAALTVLVANMQANGAVQTEILRQMLTNMNNAYKKLCDIQTELEKQGKTQSQIKSAIDEYCVNAISQMQTIASLLGTDSPIYQKVVAIYNAYVKGQKTAQEAYEEMLKLLSSIDSKIDVLIQQNEDIKTALDSVLTNQVEHNNITKEQADVFLKAYDKILAEIKAGNINADNYYTASYQHWFQEDSQRAIMIQLLIKNGYTQEQALKYLEDLDIKVTQGEENAKIAFEELMNVLKNISSTVDAIYQKLTEFFNTFNKFFSEYKNNASAIKQLVKDVRNGVYNISSDVNKISQKINTSLSGVEAQLKNIAALIVKADANNVEALKEGKDEIIAVLTKLGYSQTEIIKMSMEEVKAAIEKGNQYIQNNGAVLSKILSYVSVLPELKDQGKITNTRLDLIYNKLNDIKIDVEISPEVLAELEALLDQYFDEIAEILNDIDNNITKQGENVTEELKKINANVTVIKGDVATIKDDSAIQKAYLQYILAAVQNIDGTTVNIEELAKQIGVDVAWIRAHGGGSGSSVDLSKIENYLKQILAEQEATNVKLDLLLALQSKDSDKIDEALKYLKSLDSTTKSILDNEKNFKDIVITAFASFGVQMDENNAWLEKIYNKKCNCAKDVTIIVEKIYKYLVGNEGIVDYDKLFDDLFGDDTTSTSNSVTKSAAKRMAGKFAQNNVINANEMQDVRNKAIFADATLRIANEISKKTTGNPIQNGIYTIGNVRYEVRDLDKTLPAKDLYKIMDEVDRQNAAKEVTFKDIRHFRNFQRNEVRNA